MLEVPIVVIVCGEGGSGGALGIAIGDRVLMQEYAVYSVIPPEGCAAILWRDREPEGRGGRGAEDHRARSAARSASSTRSCPSRSAARTTTHDAATALVDQALSRGARRAVAPLTVDERLDGALRQVPAHGPGGPGFIDTEQRAARRLVRRAHEVAPLGSPAVRRRPDADAGGGARPASDRRAAAVPARLRRSGRRPTAS